MDQNLQGLIGAWNWCYSINSKIWKLYEFTVIHFGPSVLYLYEQLYQTSEVSALHSMDLGLIW